MTALDVARTVACTAVLILAARGQEQATDYGIELREWARTLTTPKWDRSGAGDVVLRRVTHLAAAAIRAEEIALVIELELIEEEVFIAWDGSGGDVTDR